MHGEPLMSHEQMRQAVFEHIEVGQRRHSGPDYLGSGNYEKNFFAGCAGEAPPLGGAKGQVDKGLDPRQAESRHCRCDSTA